MTGGRARGTLGTMAESIILGCGWLDAARYALAFFMLLVVIVVLVIAAWELRS